MPLAKCVLQKWAKTFIWPFVVATVLVSQVAHAQTISLAFRPVAAAYSHPLDRLILVAGSPNRLHIYNPAASTEVTVDLAKPPLDVSISPDGRYAAVGHDGLISYVNLAAAGVERTFTISVSAQYVVLSSSWIYVMPTNVGGSVSVNIATGAVTPNTQIFYGSGGKFNPAVNAIYGTRDGSSPNDVQKYDISTGPITKQTDSIYHGDYPACGPIFFSRDYERIYTGCGTVFRASKDPGLDMRYVTTLNAAATMRSLTESTATGKIALIQNISTYYSPSPGSPQLDDSRILLYETEHLNPIGQFLLPDVQGGAKGFKAHGKWLFFNAASTALYVIVQADQTSGILEDFAIQTISMAEPAPCGAAFASTSATAIAEGTLATVNVQAGASCTYNAATNVPWIQIVSGGYGSGNGTLKYIVRANSGASRVGAITIGSSRISITQAAASNSGTLTRLPYNIVTAAYDKPLDRLIMVSTNPNELHIYDAARRSEDVVPLPMPPLSISIRPDGLFAAVGHDGWVSYIDLQLGAVLQVYQVITDVGSIVLASNGYMYLFPARDWSDIYSLNMTTGIATATSAIYNGRVARLYGDGNYLYVGGNWFSKWFIGNGVAKLANVNSSSSSVSTCGNLWLSEDARRLFTACAKAYRTSSASAEDLQANGSFSTLTSIAWADESAAQRKTVVLARTPAYDSPGATQLQVYGDAFLDFTGSLPLPSFTVDAKTYSGYGQSVFWNRADDKVVVVLKADPQANLASSYALTVMSPSPAGQNILTLPEKGGISRATEGGSFLTTVGWARFTPNFGSSTPAGLAIFGARRNGVLISEATVPTSSPLQSGRIYAEVNPIVNTGIALANPTSAPANVAFYFTDQNGANFGAGNTTIPANGQIASFLNEAPFFGGASLSGTFTFTSDVAIGAIALRGFINQRSDFLWTTVPVSAVNGFVSQAIFPSFADGGNWTTEFLLVNYTDSTMNGNLQFYSQGSSSAPGSPLMVTVEGRTGTSFPYSIPARSSRKLTTSAASPNLVVGSARIVSSGSTPSGVAIFSSKNELGITISQAGVPTATSGSISRLYVESSPDSSRIQTGLALANPSTSPLTTNLELTTLSGASTGLTGAVTIPGNGQVQLFLNQIRGFEGLPASFQGLLKISSPSFGLAVVGLRTRYNERGDFLITTTMPVSESSSSPSSSASDLLFPHLADGGGFTTQFILFNNSSYPQPSEGALQLNTQTGQGLNLTLR